jgi:hypothetical protein
MLNLRKCVILLFPVACLAAQVVSSQEIKFPALQGFRLRENYPVYTSDNLWDFIDGAADSYLGYGFIDAHVAEYKRGRENIKAEIYHHKDHTMAFGIYSSERSPSFRFNNTGAQGYATDGSLNFFKGNYYVKLRTFSKKQATLQAEQALATRIAAAIEGSDKMPEALALFPGEGKIANSEAFINENVLGHGFLSNAFKADYLSGPDNFSIFIIRNPSADTGRKTLEIYMTATGIDAAVTGEDKYVLSDGYNGKVFVALKDDLLVIVSGLAKDQAEIADRYISEILK